jgi:hypothetical protein
VPDWIGQKDVRAMDDDNKSSFERFQSREQAGAKSTDPNDETSAAGGEDDLGRTRARAARAAAQAKIDELNRKHFVINNIGGKCLVGEFVPSSIDPKCMVLSLQAASAFAMRYGNQKVAVIKKGVIEEEDDDSRSYHELGRYWLKHRNRRSYEGMDLVPNGPTVLPGNRLNLWRGLGVTPKQGEYPLIKAHLNTILANGDPLAARYIWSWTAWGVQHPDMPAEVALVFQGLKGVGKGFWAHAVRRIFGEHGLYINSPTHLVGNFNGHLEGCVLLFSDEAFAVTDKRSESTLKGLLTEPVLIVERKGIDARQVKNLLHIIMVANHDWVVPATGDERRFAVNAVSGERRGDRGYFAALYAELNNGGLEALLYDLLHTDLGNWHPREIYETDALREQKVHSLSGEDEWLEAVLQEGALPSHLKDCPDRAIARTLAEDVRDRVPAIRYKMSDTAFGRFLRKNGCVSWRTAGIRGWQFPPLNEMRASWEKRFGGWKWDELGLKDWQVVVRDLLKE